MFKIFKEAVSAQIKSMESTGELFYVNVDKDELWELYLSSFPEGSNPIFRERSEHDCSCCKQFIRAFGHVVAIVDNEIVSIWDIKTNHSTYTPVAKALSAKIKDCKVAGIFRSNESQAGTDYNHEMIEGVPKRWEHFYHKYQDRYVLPRSQGLGTFSGNAIANKEVFERSLTEISKESCEIVKELIDQNSLYRGEEHLRTVKTLIALFEEFETLDQFNELDKDLYYWRKSAVLKEAGRFKNTVIGTLLADISSGVALEDAVKMFESKVAPENYKRPTALVTKAMIEKAESKVLELGIQDSLQRRYAVTDDITVANVIYADRSVKSALGGSVFDDLKNDVADAVPDFDKVKEVTIDKFIEDVLPTANSVELMVTNEDTSNLVSLIAPVNQDAPNILKWGNNFSWSYNGDVTDSMKDRVKKAGGKVDGVLRFSIQWNEDGNNQNDLDAHCVEPNNNLISYPKKGQVQRSSGMLDIDIQIPGGDVAVENIIYTDLNHMPEGNYQFLVHNFADRGGRGFSAEIEFNGKIHSFRTNGKLRSGAKIKVATINYSKTHGFTIKESMKSESSTKQIWGINTYKWHKVSMIMNSPNHWDENEAGNRHTFFMLDGCKNPEKSRGLYNEFLKNDLTEHRKVFEMLGTKMKAEYNENQLSGVGYSSTMDNSVMCKISGKTNRIIKIIF